jgi:hypothetical protein
VTSIAELVAKVKLPEDVVPIVMRGDLLAELHVLEEELSNLRKTIAPAADDRLVPQAPPGAPLEARIAELQEEIRQSVERFRVRAISDTALADLTAQHPPRDGNDEDRQFGYNYDSFSTALVAACLIDPVVESPQDIESLRAALVRPQWHALVNAAYAVTSNDPGAAPFLRAG